MDTYVHEIPLLIYYDIDRTKIWSTTRDVKEPTKYCIWPAQATYNRGCSLFARARCILFVNFNFSNLIFFFSFLRTRMACCLFWHDGNLICLRFLNGCQWNNRLVILICHVILACRTLWCHSPSNNSWGKRWKSMIHGYQLHMIVSVFLPAFLCKKWGLCSMCMPPKTCTWSRCVVFFLFCIISVFTSWISMQCKVTHTFESCFADPV